jgi:hypothetical protein
MFNMRLLVLSGWLSLGLLIAVGQSSSVLLEGLVVDATTDNPLSGVLIEIAGLRVSTGADGRFSLNVPPGRHLLTASKAGYLQARPEGRLSGREGLELSLNTTASPLALNLRLYRAGAVSGRVYDISGKPLNNVLIIPYRWTYDSEGKRTFQRLTLSSNSIVSQREIRGTIGFTRILKLPNSTGYERGLNIAAGRTNDLGEFRVSNLEPGQYAFYAVPMSLEPALLPLFYPGLAKPGDADIVEVAAGSELQLRNMLLGAGGSLSRLRLFLFDETGISQAEAYAYAEVRYRGRPESIAYVGQAGARVNSQTQIVSRPPCNFLRVRMIFKAWCRQSHLSGPRLWCPMKPLPVRLR